MGYSIGPKIGIEGEREFRNQIKNINTEYKALEAETRALTAAFEANGDEQGKLEGTAKVLERQIDSQKRKMKLLEDAVEKASRQYGENSVEVIRLRGALYDTEATLTGLEGILRETNQRLNDSSSAMSEAEEEANQLAEAEAQLKKQISDVDSEYKAIVAETKALTAEYEANGDKQRGLEVASQQLEKQIDSQKKKLVLLQSSIEVTTKKYGENASETNKLRASLFDTEATLTGLEGELKDVVQQLSRSSDAMEVLEDSTEDAGDAALGFKDILGANFVADLAVDALHEVADAAVEFAKGMPEATAEVNAANAQFEQTFGELEGTAKAALQSISDETEIAVTRIQGGYTELYAFTKSIGADSEAALDISGRAMLAAADNAAYFDKSIEEATEQLQSFLKGNYENDAALGIAATETTRNAKANEMYATSFEKLTEAQKVDVLLAMVEAGNAASGAMGQAAREADAWTNVQGELDEAIKQFQATLGQPALKLITPIIQGITESIYELIEEPDWKVLKNGINDFTDAVETAENRFNSARAEAETSALVAEQYVERLKELEAAGLDTAESQREYENTVKRLNELYPELNLQIDENTGLVNENSDAILDNIEAQKQKALYAATEERYTAALKAQAEAELAVGDAEYERLGIAGQRQALEEQLTEATGMTADQLNSLYRNQMLVNGAMDTGADVAAGTIIGLALMGETIDNLTPTQMEMLSQWVTLQEEETLLNNTILQGKDTIASFDDELVRLEESLNLVTASTANTTAAQDPMIEKIKEVEQTLADLALEYDQAKLQAQEAIESQIGLFDQLTVESQLSTADIIANWQSQQDAFTNYAANLQKATDMNLDQALIEQLSDGSVESMAILDELVNGTEINIEEINAAFQDRMQAEDLVTSAMAEARTGANEEMAALAEDAASWGIDIVDGAVAGIDANAPRFNAAMSRLASGGEQAFRNTMVIFSPSRLMADDNEDVVAGAVLGIERNIAAYEAAMEELGSSGYLAYLDSRIEAAENYPSMMNATVNQNVRTTAQPINYGGFNFEIYQQPGEDATELAYRIMDVIQVEIDKREVSISAYK